MGKVGYRFLVVFFTWFGALIVFINFVGWSGAYINIASGGSVNWTNSYFGFTSVQTMIKALNTSMNAIPKLSVAKFTDHLNDFLDSCAFGIPALMQSIAGGKKATLDAVLKVLLMVFGGQPILMIFRLVVVFAHFVYYAVNFVAIVVMALGGNFNIPFDNPLTPTDYLNNVRITVPIMV